VRVTGVTASGSTEAVRAGDLAEAAMPAAPKRATTPRAAAKKEEGPKLASLKTVRGQA
jgi:hypothetical protein